MHNETSKGKLSSTLALLLVSAAMASCAVQAPSAPVTTRALAVFHPSCMPRYPMESALRGSQGAVDLNFYVESDGRVSDGRIDRSSGDPLLDNAALNALKGCRFKPALDAGRPVAQWTVVHYVWTIEDD
jgi:TonB family protein